MPALTPLVTAADLRNTLKAAVYIAIFDDNNDGIAELLDTAPQVLLVLRRAHTRVVSRLGDLYAKIPDGVDAPNIPDLLFDAELNYCIGLAFDRSPEFTKNNGFEPQRKSAYAQADSTMQLLQEAILRIVDFPPAAAPFNVGGAVLDSGQRTVLDSTNGQRNSGDL